MKKLTNVILFFTLMIFTATAGFAQSQDIDQLATPDSTNIYIGEAVGRSPIEATELPKEVIDSLKSSKYAEMDMIAVYKVNIVPGKETATDSTMRNAEAANSRRPYKMRDENLDMNETYYQDTYNDVEEEKVGTAQENATDADMTEDIDPTSEGQVTQKQVPDNVDTYYEIEMNGGFVLLFDDKGLLTFTSSEDM